MILILKIMMALLIDVPIVFILWYYQTTLIVLPLVEKFFFMIPYITKWPSMIAFAILSLLLSIFIYNKVISKKLPGTLGEFLMRIDSDVLEKDTYKIKKAVAFYIIFLFYYLMIN